MDSCVKINPTATETKKTNVMNASRVRKIVLEILKLSFTAGSESELIRWGDFALQCQTT